MKPQKVEKALTMSNACQSLLYFWYVLEEEEKEKEENKTIATFNLHILWGQTALRRKSRSEGEGEGGESCMKREMSKK